MVWQLSYVLVSGFYHCPEPSVRLLVLSTARPEANLSSLAEVYKRSKNLERSADLLSLLSDCIGLAFKTLAESTGDVATTLDSASGALSFLDEASRDEALPAAGRSGSQRKKNIKGFTLVLRKLLSLRTDAAASKEADAAKGFEKAQQELLQFVKSFEETTAHITESDLGVDAQTGTWISLMKDNTAAERKLMATDIQTAASRSMASQIRIARDIGGKLAAVAGGGEKGQVWHSTLPDGCSITDHYAETLEKTYLQIEQVRVTASKEPRARGGGGGGADTCAFRDSADCSSTYNSKIRAYPSAPHTSEASSNLGFMRVSRDM